MTPVPFVAAALLGPAAAQDIQVRVNDPPAPAGVVARLGSPRFRGGHADRVFYSRDAKHIATSGFGGVFVYDAATGRRLLSVTAPPNLYPPTVNALGFGPAGELVVAWYPHAYPVPPGELVRIDVPSGRILSRVRPADRRGYAALSRDGRRVVSVAHPGGNVRDEQVVVDDVATGREVWRRAVPNVYYQVGMAADGSRVFYWVSGTARVELVDTETGNPAEVTDYTPRQDPGEVALYSAAGPLVSTDWFNGVLDVRPPGADRPAFAFKQRYRSEAPVFTPVGKRAVFTSHTGFEVWDAVAWRKLADHPAAGLGEAKHAAVSPDGTTLAGGGSHATLLLYDLTTGKRLPQSADPAGDVGSLRWEPDGRLAAEYGVDGTVAYDVATGAGEKRPAGPPGLGFGVWDADRTRYAVKTPTGATLYDPAGKPVEAFAGEAAEHPRFTPDGKRLVLFGKTEAAVWDLAARTAVRVPLGAAERFNRQARWAYPSADGKHLVVFREVPGSFDGTRVTFHDLTTGKAVREFRTDAGISGGEFTPDGQYLLAPRTHPDPIDAAPEPDEYWLGLYDAATGKLLRRMPPADGLVRLAPDGKTYAVAHADRGIAFYDTATGAGVRRLLPALRVTQMAFRPDGKQLATAHVGSPVLVWDLGEK